MVSCAHKTAAPAREETAVPVENIYQSKDFNLTFKTEHFDSWMSLYLVKSPDRLIRHLTNGEKFRPIVTAVLKEYGLPEDIFYVGLIESGFYLRSESTASAVGPWQFIKGTGKHFGLRVDSSVDERMNIYKSTVAAAKYFKELYRLFDNWELALCAYNSGENRVKNAIRKGGTRDYLELVDLGLLPKETILYVPKIVAMRHIERNLEKYNITDIEKNSELFENAVPKIISKSFTLSDLKSKTGMTDEEMLVLNADLKKEKIILNKKIIVYIPKRSAQLERLSSNEIILPMLALHKAERKIAAISAVKIKTKSNDKKPKVVFHKYIVKKGDNLHAIAKKFKTTTQVILTSNGIKSKKILKGQSLKIPKNQKVVRNI
jgi:membrane-bound lytic murein transglycosylase D